MRCDPPPTRGATRRLSMTSAAEAALPPLHGSIDTVIRLEWAEAPGTRRYSAIRVVQVSRIEARTGASAADLAPFVAAARSGRGLASCRPPRSAARIDAARGGRLSFHRDGLPARVRRPAVGRAARCTGLVVERARPEDLEESSRWPEAPSGTNVSMSTRGCHRGLGPALPELGAQQPRASPQRLHALREGRTGRLLRHRAVADGTCYWHLNAVVPNRQGRGLFARAWRAMMNQARLEGATRGAYQHRGAQPSGAQPLCARLGFGFPAPPMTFHRVRAA